MSRSRPLAAGSAERRHRVGILALVVVLVGFAQAEAQDFGADNLGSIYALESVPDTGKRLIRIDPIDGSVDIVSGPLERTFAPTAPLASDMISWTGTGDWYFVDRERRRIFRVDGDGNRTLVFELANPNGAIVVTSLEALPDGRLLAFRYPANVARLDPATGEAIELPGSGTVTPASYDSTSGTILTGDFEYELTVGETIRQYRVTVYRQSVITDQRTVIGNTIYRTAPASDVDNGIYRLDSIVQIDPFRVVFRVFEDAPDAPIRPRWAIFNVSQNQLANIGYFDTQYAYPLGQLGDNYTFYNYNRHPPSVILLNRLTVLAESTVLGGFGPTHTRGRVFFGAPRLVQTGFLSYVTEVPAYVHDDELDRQAVTLTVKHDDAPSVPFRGEGPPLPASGTRNILVTPNGRHIVLVQPDGIVRIDGVTGDRTGVIPFEREIGGLSSESALGPVLTLSSSR